MAKKNKKSTTQRIATKAAKARVKASSLEMNRVKLPSKKEVSTVVANIISGADESPSLKATRKILTVRETKLGVTMVLSPEDVQKLGIGLDTPTPEVVDAVRAKLKLEPRRRALKATA